MKVGDLIKAYSITGMKSYIGVITAVAHDPIHPNCKYRYKVFFPNAPEAWWNDGTWNKKALELV